MTDPVPTSDSVPADDQVPAADPVATDLPEAFYLPVGEEEFESTRATMSPWNATMQHGGPPAALLARAVERVRPAEGMAIGRLTIDMLGPIPQGRIRTQAQILRPGRRVELVEARMWVNDQLAVTATAWRLRATPGATDAQAHLVEPCALPEEQEQRFFPGLDDSWGYGRAIEWRFVEGGYADLGPADVWTRVRIPLVAGEEITPLERAAIIADSANGLSGELPLTEWLFIPPTMTLTLSRVPTGEWIHLAARSVIAGSGTGLAFGELHDQDGIIGTVNQPLLVAPR